MILTVGNQNKKDAKSLKASTWMIMKLTIALLLVFTFQANAKSHGQGITIIKNNIHLSEVFRDIEKQTGYLFFYDKALIEKTVPIDVVLKDATLEHALLTCLKGQQLTYTIVKNTVVIQPQEIPKSVSFQIANVTALPPPVEIHGRVVDQKGVPLQNVSVLIAGTKIGTTTNSDGRFTLTAPDNKNITLEVSSVGFQSKRVNVGKQTEINVVLEMAETGLSGVVVVGYGTQKKLSITGAVSTVDAGTIREAPEANLGSRLQGRISGVTVTKDNSPGGVPIIRVRGYWFNQQ